MSKLIMFSTRFPSKHHNQGEPTFFAEKLMASFADVVPNYKMPDDFVQYDWHQYYNCGEYVKHHTFRAGFRFKEGDLFRPCIWQLPGGMYKKGNKALRLSTIDINITKIWTFKIYRDGGLLLTRNRQSFHTEFGANQYRHIARHDGLTPEDFKDWFRVHSKGDKNAIEGQVLCWNDKISYFDDFTGN